MGLLTNISGVPLFSTIQEALDWAASVGLTGYHTHQYQGVTGYMGGTNHNNAITGANFSAPPPPPPAPPTMGGPSITTTGGGGSSGGGGY